MSTLRIMNGNGDSQVAWDLAKVANGDPEATAAVAEAGRIFAEVRAAGGTAFSLGAGRRPARLDEFDATAEQIVLVPRIVGG